MSIIAEFPGLFQVFSDGSVKRFDIEIATASTETSNGYKSKDVTIDSSKPITARIFLPDDDVPDQSLPVLVYFHGGGFCIGSTKWLAYHSFLGDLSVISKTIVFSVDYRLAPENKLPIAFDDCYASLEWLSKNKDSEPWLQRANLARIFLSGDSAGGNIVHQVATRAIRNEVCNVRIKGLLPTHPFFGSEKRTEQEKDDMFWKLSLPEGENCDYYGCNFENTELSADEWSKFPEVLVFVAGLDFLKERGVSYAEFLQKKGVRKVKLIEAKDKAHVYHIFHPESEATSLLKKQISDFISSL